MDLIKVFRQNETFNKLEDDQLQFLVDKGKLDSFEKGEFLFKKGEDADELIFVISGRFRIYLMQNNQKREVGMIETGDITGLLPYSRMTHASGFATAIEKSEVFKLHRNTFREMIVDYHPLAEALVQHMATRIRTFTKMRAQDEKLMSLGKLSAGLAHELNNPASAMVRSSEALMNHLKLLPEGFKSVMKAKLDPAVVDEVNDWLFDILGSEQPHLSLMQRNSQEESIADLLDEYELENAFELAEELVEFGIKPEKVEGLYELVGKEDFGTVINWVANNINTERMVEEISASATKIATLIKSIKEYSHMDRSQDRQPVDINEGLSSTITMLKHKAKSNQIQIDENFEEKLPLISGFPGELNQVWTNIIDNAIDAMEGEGGILSIQSEWCEPFVKVRIEDNGVGIPEEIQNQIYDPFFTTKEIGKGTGLGLDIVSKIISKHKSIINLESKPGRTVFEIQIPAAEEI